VFTVGLSFPQGHMQSEINRNAARRLAADIRDGSKEAFELFYRMEFNNLVHFCRSYLHDTKHAEDIAQEALCMLWEKHQEMDPEKNLRAFVFRSARNMTINALKKKSFFTDKANRVEISEDILALKDESMDNLIESLELARLIENIYRNLPDTVKDSFVMSRQMGMTHKEIALTKKMSQKAIEYHINISLKIFRKKLKEYLSV